MMRFCLPLILLGIVTSSPAESLRLEGSAFRVPTNCDIVWSATNPLPRGLWIYKVMPEAFTAAVVSNAMAIGHFQMENLTKSDGSQFQDKHLIYFWNKNEFDRPRFLSIAPTLGMMKYVSRKDSTVAVEDVPTSAEAETLARDVLFQLGIDRSLLADRIRHGYDETSSPIDRQSHPLGSPQVVTRGLSFERRVDGIALSADWCFLIHFGSHGRIEDFTLRWRNLLPSESHGVLARDEIIQTIKSGQAVMPEQFYDTSGLKQARNLTIVKAIPRYYDGTGKQALPFLWPYLELEVQAELASKATSVFVLRSPILSGPEAHKR